MKICYISDMRSPHTMRWVAHFARRHEVDLISFDYGRTSDMFLSDRDYEAIGVKLHKIPKTPFSMLMSPFAVRALLRRIEPDIVHAQFLTHYGFLAAISGFHPFVVSPWGSDITRDVDQSMIFRFTVKYGLKHADMIQCMDESFADRVKTLIGADGAVKVVGEGIDPLLFHPSGKQAEGAPINVLCLRKSQPPYNIEVLLHAIPKVLEKHESVMFTLLNGGADLQDTIDMVHDLGLQNHIIFIDVMPNNEVPATLNRADIYVDTFFKNVSGSGIGKTALEAMCCELPVVLSDSVGVGLHINHRVNGWIYKGLDSKSLADAIIELMNQPELRDMIGKNAGRYVVAHQDFGRNMMRMEQCYAELVK